MKRLIVRSQPAGTGPFAAGRAAPLKEIDRIFGQLRRKLIYLEMMLRDKRLPLNKRVEQAHDFVVVELYDWLEPVFEFVAVGNDLRVWRAQKRGEAQRLNTDERHKRRGTKPSDSTQTRRKRAR